MPTRRRSWAEPWKVKMVEPIKMTTREFREQALEEALNYVKVREAFGKRIGDFQYNAFRLADMATEIQAARHLTYHAAWLKDQGRPFSTEAAMAKLFASEAANRITDRASRVLGSYGFASEYPVERYYRDAKLTEIG